MNHLLKLLLLSGACSLLGGCVTTESLIQKFTPLPDFPESKDVHKLELPQPTFEPPSEARSDFDNYEIGITAFNGRDLYKAQQYLCYAGNKGYFDAQTKCEDLTFLSDLLVVQRHLKENPNMTHKPNIELYNLLKSTKQDFFSERWDEYLKENPIDPEWLNKIFRERLLKVNTPDFRRFVSSKFLTIIQQALIASVNYKPDFEKYTYNFTTDIAGVYTPNIHTVNLFDNRQKLDWCVNKQKHVGTQHQKFIDELLFNQYDKNVVHAKILTEKYQDEVDEIHDECVEIQELIDLHKAQQKISKKYYRKLDQRLRADEIKQQKQRAEAKRRKQQQEQEKAQAEFNNSEDELLKAINKVQNQ